MTAVRREVTPQAVGLGLVPCIRRGRSHLSSAEPALPRNSCSAGGIWLFRTGDSSDSLAPLRRGLTDVGVRTCCPRAGLLGVRFEMSVRSAERTVCAAFRPAFAGRPGGCALCSAESGSLRPGKPTCRQRSAPGRPGLLSRGFDCHVLNGPIGRAVSYS